MVGRVWGPGVRRGLTTSPKSSMVPAGSVYTCRQQQRSAYREGGLRAEQPAIMQPSFCTSGIAVAATLLFQPECIRVKFRRRSRRSLSHHGHSQRPAGSGEGHADGVAELFALSNGRSAGAEGAGFGDGIECLVHAGPGTKEVVAGEEPHVDVAVGVAPRAQLHLGPPAGERPVSACARLDPTPIRKREWQHHETFGTLQPCPPGQSWVDPVFRGLTPSSPMRCVRFSAAVGERNSSHALQPLPLPRHHRPT